MSLDSHRYTFKYSQHNPNHSSVPNLYIRNSMKRLHQSSVETVKAYGDQSHHYYTTRATEKSSKRNGSEQQQHSTILPFISSTKSPYMHQPLPSEKSER